MLRLTDFTLYPLTAERGSAYAETLMEPATVGMVEINLDGTAKIDQRFLDAVVASLKAHNLTERVVWVTDDRKRRLKIRECAQRQVVSLRVRTYAGIPQWTGLAPLTPFPWQEWRRLEEFVVAEPWQRRLSKNGWQVLHHTRVLRLDYEVLRSDTGEWELQNKHMCVWVEDGALSMMRRMRLRNYKEQQARKLLLQHLAGTVGQGFIHKPFGEIPITLVRVIPGRQKAKRATC